MIISIVLLTLGFLYLLVKRPRLYSITLETTYENHRLVDGELLDHVLFKFDIDLPFIPRKGQVLYLRSLGGARKSMIIVTQDEPGFVEALHRFYVRVDTLLIGRQEFLDAGWQEFTEKDVPWRYGKTDMRGS